MGVYDNFTARLEAGDFEGAMESIRGVGDIMTKPDDPASVEKALELVFEGWIKIFPITAVTTVLDTSRNTLQETVFLCDRLMRWFEDHKAFVHVCKKWYENTSGPDKTLRDVLVRMELLDVLRIPTFSKMEKKCWEYYNADPDKEETCLKL